jgi:hypothetical protein
LNTAVSSAAKRMSNDSEISLPPPPARPSIAAIATLGIVRNVSFIVCHELKPICGGPPVAPSRASSWPTSTSR